MKNIRFIGFILLMAVINISSFAQVFYPPYPPYPPRDYHAYHPYHDNDQYAYRNTSNSHPLLFSLNYNVAGTLGSAHDFVGNVSPRGWYASLLYPINANWAVGLSGGYQDYYQKIPRQVYHQPGSDISAVQTHVIESIPIMATGQYSFSTDHSLHPYVSLGVGVNNINYQQWWGEYEQSDNRWKFAVSPAVGLEVPFTKSQSVGLNIQAGYAYSPYNRNGINNVSNWFGRIGLFASLR
ncbi:outer membrane beta-barrel protein [Thermoflavifilum thermophilum]|uniref:Outer membrane protein beta-barrel domain-containing protein n=1 Tax=Thermoflavifilum thermophilum TaxID=1393122 RepID=A0A1I7MZX6_9BACT|nr:outer membrane beta-barrel protein [Thermoflavifilum thermophilum]SFV27961.1 Outer membrane protein beta-barrel domain-containing protein [Thermoflavifilum thermophilum]